MTSKQAKEVEDGRSAVNGRSGMFEGMSFWLSRNVPQRSRFEELIQRNGGIVKPQEKDADVRLVDHKRKNLPPDVYSYQFIEKSVQSGKLEDLEMYKAGSSSARPDDQILWDYMQPFESDPKARIRGNKLYEDLAAKYPRHTYQSWRDRYLKRLRGLPRPGGIVETTVSAAVNQVVRAETPPHESASHQDGVVTQGSEASPRPQEKKRKRSPVSTITNEHTSTGTASAQQPDTTQQKSLEVRESSGSHVRREHTHHETPPSPKKAKTTAKPSTGEPTSQEPGEEDKTGLNELFLELPFFEPSPEPDDEAPEQDIDTWIEERLRGGKGDEAQIIEALQCTSMDPELADTVLDSLVAGNGIPADMRGVWTAQDDRCVDAQDTREIQRVLMKHGSDLFNSRWEYLTMARSAGLKIPR
ncbi:putative transcription factor Rap1 [Aspergillus lucknowensis]|uniref:DNA-binding protein RAP1 n=1 Tax=Aspergillus lucknowensis TaxID=176173 RepID=A0ABR4M261_9EURO